MSHYETAPRKAYALVVMTNNDKYFIALEERLRLETEMQQLHRPLFFKTTDAKNNTKIQLFTAHISSIVAEG